MSPRPTRRGFLSLTGRAAAAAGAVALSVPAGGTATAALRPPAAPRPAPPTPLRPQGPRDACHEPPDAGVSCDLERREV
ncbi:hypothetical protein GCM10010405_19440 [Streptomyces macrosporus]|uniref:Twin-arginine translocation signal domain-containing protein n=1 Tax=Streptomyces macrosporus TaxID=44032 RepID=A0ABP5WXK4_9ACTN